MFGLEILPGLLYKAGGALIVGELLSLAVKHKMNLMERREKASGELKGFKELEKLNSNTGLIISDNIKLKEKFMYEHLGIFAPTGAGKTTKLFINNLLSDDIKGSIIVIDAKGELYDLTSRYQKEVCGRNVLKFSPLEPETSEGYNLLEQCKDDTEVIQLATNLLMNGALSLELSTSKKAGGIEWLQMAEPLLASALLYAKGLKEPFNTIEGAFKIIIDTHNKALDILLGENENEAVRTQYNIFKTVSKAENTAGSIKVTLASNIKLFTDSKINAVGRKSTFTAEQFRKEPTILYLTFPERKSNYLAPFIAPFFNQFIDALQDVKGLPCYFYMDEFASIGIINNMATYCATVRSRQLGFILCMQSITQLMQVYGTYNAKAILNNLKTKIFLPGLSDLETLDYVEALAGKTEITAISESKNSKNEATTNKSTTTRNVVNGDEVRRIRDNECLIITGNKQPVKDTQSAYYESVVFNDRVLQPLNVYRSVKACDISKELRKLIQVEVEKKLEQLREEFKVQEQDKAEQLTSELF